MYFRSFCPQKLSQKYTLGSKTPEKVQHLLIVFIGTFCDMTIIGHQGGQRTAVRLDIFMPIIAYLYFRQGE